MIYLDVDILVQSGVFGIILKKIIIKKQHLTTVMLLFLKKKFELFIFNFPHNNTFIVPRIYKLKKIT